MTIADCEEILTDAHLGDSISVNGKRRQRDSQGKIDNNISPASENRNMPYRHHV